MWLLCTLHFVFGDRVSHQAWNSDLARLVGQRAQEFSCLYFSGTGMASINPATPGFSMWVVGLEPIPWLISQALYWPSSLPSPTVPSPIPVWLLVAWDDLVSKRLSLYWVTDWSGWTLSYYGSKNEQRAAKHTGKPHRWRWQGARPHLKKSWTGICPFPYQC